MTARLGRPPVVVALRFWPKVNLHGDGDCWVWLAHRNRAGYGRFDNKQAHRVAYELLVGPIPEGLQLDHLCRNPPCVNPTHLEPVTGKENIHRSPIHQRVVGPAMTHCRRGHEFTPENTYRFADGHRTCRECVLTRCREYKRKKAAA